MISAVETGQIGNAGLGLNSKIYTYTRENKG
jgi:hypothetical protein